MNIYIIVEKGDLPLHKTDWPTNTTLPIYKTKRVTAANCKYIDVGRVLFKKKDAK